MDWNLEAETFRSPGCVEQNAIPTFLGRTQAWWGLFLLFLSLKVCPFHGRKTWMEVEWAAMAKPLWRLWSQETWYQPYSEALWGYFFHSSYADIRPDVLAGGVPIMSWKKALTIVQHQRKVYTGYLGLLLNIFWFLLWTFQRWRLFSTWSFNYQPSSIQFSFTFPPES